MEGIYLSPVDAGLIIVILMMILGLLVIDFFKSRRIRRELIRENLWSDMLRRDLAKMKKNLEDYNPDPIDPRHQCPGCGRDIV